MREMAIELSTQLVNLINDYETIKVLATVDEKGQPHSILNQHVTVLEDGRLVYLEHLESSRSYKNFTRSLWYDQKVSITVVGKKGASWQIKGKPERIIVSGPIFEYHYKKLREIFGDIDLAAVCIIEPEELIDESFGVQFENQEKDYLIFKHLDRLARWD
jgi:hypothetical protein